MQSSALSKFKPCPKFNSNTQGRKNEPGCVLDIVDESNADLNAAAFPSPRSQTLSVLFKPWRFSNKFNKDANSIMNEDGKSLLKNIFYFYFTVVTFV